MRHPVTFLTPISCFKKPQRPTCQKPPASPRNQRTLIEDSLRRKGSRIHPSCQFREVGSQLTWPLWPIPEEAEPRRAALGPALGQPRWVLGCTSHGAVSGSALQFQFNTDAGQDSPTLRSRSLLNPCQPPRSRTGRWGGKGASAKGSNKSAVTTSKCSPQVKKNNLLCVLEAQVRPTLLQSRPALCRKLGFFQQNKLLQQQFETREADTTEQLLPCPPRAPSLL